LETPDETQGSRETHRFAPNSLHAIAATISIAITLIVRVGMLMAVKLTILPISIARRT
jgi:hypothetical protein